MKWLKKITSNKIINNAGWLIAGKVIQMALGFLVGILTARYLGPSNFGLINYAGAYVSFFSALCTLGINSVIVKEIIEHTDNEGMVLGTAILLKTVSSFISALMIIAIVSIVDHGEKTTIIVAALSSIGAVFNVLETFNYWFQSKLQSKVTAIAALVAYMITAAYRILLMIKGSSIEWFAFATSVDYIIAGVILFAVYKKNGGAKLSFSCCFAKSLLKESSPFIMSSLMVAIYGQTDKIMLKQMISNAEIGYYSTASALNSKWCFVLSAIIDSMVPVILSANKEKDKDKFLKSNKTLYAIVFYCSCCVAVLFTILGNPIVLLLYGEAYLPAVMPLRIIAWYTAFSYLGAARDVWVVCMNAQKSLTYIYAAAAISNVFFNFLLIPSYGAAGAAWASLIAQVVTTMIAPFFIKNMRENSILMIKGILLQGLLPSRHR